MPKMPTRAKLSSQWLSRKSLTLNNTIQYMRHSFAAIEHPTSFTEESRSQNQSVQFQQCL